MAKEAPILIFDGVCNICSFGVGIVLRADKQGVFRFAFGQGERGSALKEAYGLPKGDLENVTLIEDGRYYTKSDAVIEVVRRLPFPWPLLSIFKIVPKFLRDPLYSLVARNRYRWFGIRQSCFVPAPEHLSQFVDKP
jgi:predicted DCC family thiol-disulfide oxidoreductase YuxK